MGVTPRLSTSSRVLFARARVGIALIDSLIALDAVKCDTGDVRHRCRAAGAAEPVDWTDAASRAGPRGELLTPLACTARPSARVGSDRRLFHVKRRRGSGCRTVRRACLRVARRVRWGFRRGSRACHRPRPGRSHGCPALPACGQGPLPGSSRTLPDLRAGHHYSRETV